MSILCRRRRDSNPRTAFDGYTISSRAPSTRLGDFSTCLFNASHYISILQKIQAYLTNCRKLVFNSSSCVLIVIVLIGQGRPQFICFLSFLQKIFFFDFGLILPFDLDHLLQYMRLECLFLTKKAIISLAKSLACCFNTFPKFFCKFLTNPFLKNAVLFGCFSFEQAHFQGVRILYYKIWQN